MASNQNPAAKQLEKAAKQVLKPAGLKQKGKSRMWLDDRVFWLGVVEFQPSSWQDGSFLNVGACWLWHKRDYFAFDSGPYRIREFEKFKSEEQFEAIAIDIAEQAKAEIEKLRADFANLASISKQLKTQKRPVFWAPLNAAIATALLGEISDASNLFEVAATTCVENSPVWQVEGAADARRLSAILNQDRKIFEDEILERIKYSRAALKLKECLVNFY